jgi:hypothetical protein
MTIPLDQARIDAFGQKMVETLNHAGLALMISIGHRNGLFDVLSRLPRLPASGSRLRRVRTGATSASGWALW